MSNNLLFGAADATVHPKSSRSTSGLSPYTGAWTKKEVVHLLKRTMFGATFTDINYFLSQSMSDSVNELLNASVSPPAPPLKNYSNTDDDAYVTFGQTWVNSPPVPGVTGLRGASLKAWWMGLMINQNRSIEQKMTLFWQNHLASQIQNYAEPRYGYRYLETIRANALGNFKALVKAVTLEPAMLVYLNGNKNRKGVPDENYARELQELFCIGKGPNSHYTEDDVKAAARVLTGYRDDPQNINSYFDPARHDANDKQFSVFYNNTVILGQSGTNGQNELDDLLDMLFLNDECALFICRKLYRFFVYYTIDADIETNVIIPLAQVLRANNYDIKPVLSILFKSEHFFDLANRSCMIKSSVDFTVGFCRENKLVFPDATALQNQYYFWLLGEQFSATMAQDLLDQPSVAGWPAYYQEPAFHELWINSDTMPKRKNFTDGLLYAGVTKSGYKLIMDPIALTAAFSDPSNPNTLIDDVLTMMYTMEVSAAWKAYLKTYTLLSGQASDYYWTNAWNDYVADPTNASKKQIVLTRLQYMYAFIMEMPEYQLS